MNKKQRENTAKLLYDLVKLSFTGLIIAGMIPGKVVSILPLILGSVLAISAFTTAYWLERKEE